MNKTFKACAGIGFAALLSLASATTTHAQKATAAAPARPEVGEQAEAYSGDKNLLVTIVRVGKRENKQALIEIVGLDHPWNRRIFKANVTNIASGQSTAVKNNYEITVNGGSWNLATTEDNYLTLNLRENGATGRQQSYRLAFDRGIANDTKPEYLLTAYLKQDKK
ncbi:MAG TPA: hypothetical protein VF629_19015 [Hymenobacter sp.]|jgi:hypothetical protein|uniref:hypothetical protein n=1 Tax=Hymenobacter sp. TaxID=1898978 RepID=UPI002ED8E6EA